MHRPLRASDLPTDPFDFQRLALDVLAADRAADGWRIRGLDLGHGRRDEGFDGFATDPGNIDWRVEVKATREFKTLSRAIKEHVETYTDRPTLVVCRLELTESQRSKLTELRAAPAVEVVDGSNLAEALRRHPWLAGAHGLTDSSGLRPLRDLRHLELPPLQSERETADAAWESLEEDPQACLLVGDAFARPHAVAEALAAVVLRRGTPDGRSWMAASPRTVLELREADLRTALGRPDRVRLLVTATAPVGADVARALAAFLRDAPNLAVVLPSRAPATNVRRALARFEPLVAEVAAPSAAERRDALQAVARSEGPAVDAAAAELRDPELGAALVLGELESTVWERAGTSHRRAVAAAVTLLQPVEANRIASVATLVGGPVTMADLKALQAAGLLSDEGSWHPPRRVLGDALVRSWVLSDETFDSHTFLHRLGTLPDGLQHAALGRLRTATPLGEVGPPGALVEQFVLARDDAYQKRLLADAPHAFAATSELYRRGMALVLDDEDESDGARRALLGELWANGGEAGLAMQVLGQLLEHDVGTSSARSLAEQVVDPGRHVPSAGAIDAMQVVRGWLAEPAAPSWLAAVVDGVLEVRLAADVRVERDWGLTTEFFHVGWNAALESVQESFRIAVQVLREALVHPDATVRDSAWNAFPGAGRGRGGEAQIPEVLEEALQQAARATVAWIGSQKTRVDQIAYTDRLVAVARSPWGHKDQGLLDALADLLEAERSDVALLRRLVFPITSDPDPAKLRDGTDEPHRVERTEVTARDRQAVADWLATGPSRDDLEALLRDAGVLLKTSRHIPRSQVLDLLDEQAPELVDGVLFGEGWRRLSVPARALLLGTAAEKREERIADVVETSGGGARAPGVLGSLVRFLAAPERQEGPEAAQLTMMLRHRAPMRTVPGLLIRLGAHPDEQVRGVVHWWVRDWLASEPDDRDAADVLSKVSAPPFGAEVLPKVSRAARRNDRSIDGARGFELKPDSLLEQTMLDALESNLAHSEKHTLQPRHWAQDAPFLVGRWLERRPEAMWRHADAFRFLGRPSARKVLSDATGEVLLACLRAGPTTVSKFTGEAVAMEALLAALDEDDYRRGLRTLLTVGEIDRAGTWLVGRGLRQEDLDLLVDLLRALPEADRGLLVEHLGRPTGLSGTGGSRVFSIAPFQELEPPSAPPLVDALREQARGAPDLEAPLTRLAELLWEEAKAEHAALARHQWPE